LVAFVSGSEIRKNLLGLLTSGPKTPTKLASMEQKHVSHVSRALAELRSRGLVESWTSDSREHYYSVTTQGYAVFSILSRTAK
jgi:predicted transcriptional regulator